MNAFLVQVSILILLPLIPAALMFKLFRTQGKGEGKLFGFKWSFGGAFAGYLIILLILWAVMQKRMESNDAEVWTVHGKIETGNVRDISNRIIIRSIPQSLRLDEDGGYEFKVIVSKKDDTLDFPRIKIDLSQLCGGVKTVLLDDAKGTFDAIPNVKSIKIDKREATKSIYVAPIVLPPSLSTEPCGSE